MTINSFSIILLACALTISVVEDVRRLKIPNVVTYPTMVLAVGYHSFSRGEAGLMFSVAGLALGIAIFIIPYILGGMGAGDVKLMGAAGAIFGPQGIWYASFLVIMAGGIYGLILFVLHPRYALSFLKRSGTVLKTFFVTRQFILIPPSKLEYRPVLRFAIPIALGCCFYVYLAQTGSYLIQ